MLLGGWTLSGTRAVTRYYENPRVIGLGRCMEKMVGGITKKVGELINIVGVITDKVGVYTGSQKICI